MEKDMEICNEFIIKTASDTKTVPLTNFRINKYIYICCILLLLQLHTTVEEKVWQTSTILMQP